MFLVVVLIAGCKDGCGRDDVSVLDDAAKAGRFLEALADGPGAALEDEACPAENGDGDTFFHVTDSRFPNHLFQALPFEFGLTSTYGPGPDAFGEVVLCVEGGSGHIKLTESGVTNMPMPDNPLDVVAKGATSKDDGLVGGSLAVAVGVANETGEVGTYATTVTQVCDEDGGGCEQPCADPIAPTSASIFDNADLAVCNETDVLSEDGAFATLGRTMAATTTVDGEIPVAQSCVQIDFPSTAASTVRVVGSWVRDANCGGAVCADPACGTGHAYGVWASGDGGASWSHLGMAQGMETTEIPAPDPAAPMPPLVGDHFLAASTVDTVVICRLAFEEDADHVAIDYVELCGQ